MPRRRWYGEKLSIKPSLMLVLILKNLKGPETSNKIRNKTDRAGGIREPPI